MKCDILIYHALKTVIGEHVHDSMMTVRDTYGLWLGRMCETTRAYAESDWKRNVDIDLQMWRFLWWNNRGKERDPGLVASNT
jgi:hypothetical protein